SQPLGWARGAGWCDRWIEQVIHAGNSNKRDGEEWTRAAAAKRVLVTNGRDDRGGCEQCWRQKRFGRSVVPRIDRAPANPPPARSCGARRRIDAGSIGAQATARGPLPQLFNRFSRRAGYWNNVLRSRR